MNNLKPLRRGLFLVSLPIFFINFSLPVQAKQLGGNAVEIGALFGLFSLALLLLRPLVGYGLDRIGRKLFFAGAMCFYAMALCTLRKKSIPRQASAIGGRLLAAKDFRSLILTVVP